MVTSFFFIPAPPLFGALVMLLLGRKLKDTFIGVFCCATVLVSFAMAIGAFLPLLSNSADSFEAISSQWLPALGAEWGFHWDMLSGIMTLVVTGVGSLIHIYSVGYMKTEGGMYRFFGYLNFFVFAMLILVLANNYVLLFAGWEGVGLASYLLIGFWFRTWNAASSGLQAFVVNRVGDAGLILGIFFIWTTYHSVRMADVVAKSNAPKAAPFEVVALLLLIGAIGKSAQFPLHIWLPVAMAGPTPVSALIHAATMVTAGVYLIARSHVIFEQAPNVSAAIAILGAFTAIFGATVATAKTDIKRVLAWSTISQLGYMFLALGVGAYWIAIFHLVVHAFFKALMFLGAGNIIHALDGEQDLHLMGGLKRLMPKTHAVMWIGAASGAGLPLFGGFFSKDAILSNVHSIPLLAVGFLSAAITSFYLWRLMYLAFYGTAGLQSRAESPDSAANHSAQPAPHDPPAVMMAPLYVLALGAAISGAIGIWILHEPPQWISMLISTAAALTGLYLASRLHKHVWSGFIGMALAERWYVDHAIHAVFVKWFAQRGGRLLHTIDRFVIDAGVNAIAWLTRQFGNFSNWWDRWVVDGAVRFTSFTVKMSSYPARLTQTGSVQTYALVFLGGLIAVVSYVVLSVR
jgi:NADH-quinone oxidoreductase subunit L